MKKYFVILLTSVLVLATGGIIFYFCQSFRGTSDKVVTEQEINPTVHNLIILDKSGSMHPIWMSAVDGVNNTIKSVKDEFKSHPKQNQLLTLISFSADEERYSTLFCEDHISSVDTLQYLSVLPYGGTPLWDAIMFSIKTVEDVFQEGDVALVTIITDGYENASVTFNRDDIWSKIESLKGKGWTFAYIGANQDSQAVAESIGITNYLNFKADNEGTRKMWEAENESRRKYYKSSRSSKDLRELEQNYFTR